MSSFGIKDNCNTLKAKFIQQYSNLSAEDLSCNNGSTKEKMMETLRQKLGKTSDELHELILKL